jgi:outer membrane protein
MKKILAILAIATAGVLTTTTATAQKFGHIDTQVLLEGMPELKTAQAKVEQFAKQLEVSIGEMTAEYQKKVAVFQAKEATMTNTEKETAIASISELEQRIQKFQVSAQERLQKQEMELLQPIREKAKTAIEAVGKENGFVYIFDSSVGVTLYEGGTDVLLLVKKKLGLQ